MSFWLGALVAMTVWFAVQTLLSVAMYGRTMEVDRGHVAADFAVFVLLLLLTNLFHWGVV